MLPTRKEAEEILREAALCNPGKWEAHSRVTGICAEKIAQQMPTLHPEKAYILGILHDIGRKFGVKQMAHSLDGYRYLHALGYDAAAQICVTHSFPIQKFNTYIGKMDVSQQEENEMKQLLSTFCYDDYDRLIQLCDAIAMPQGAVVIEARLDDVMARYGDYPRGVREKYLALKAYFEEKTGKDLYDIIGIKSK